MKKIKEALHAKNPHIYSIGFSALLVFAGEFFPKTPYVIYGQSFQANNTQVFGLALVAVFVILPGMIGLWKRFKKP